MDAGCTRAAGRRACAVFRCARGRAGPCRLYVEDARLGRTCLKRARAVASAHRLRAIARVRRPDASPRPGRELVVSCHRLRRSLITRSSGSSITAAEARWVAIHLRNIDQQRRWQSIGKAWGSGWPRPRALAAVTVVGPIASSEAKQLSSRCTDPSVSGKEGRRYCTAWTAAPRLRDTRDQGVLLEHE
jgi:hypothetical protein